MKNDFSVKIIYNGKEIDKSELKVSWYDFYDDKRVVGSIGDYASFNFNEGRAAFMYD